MLHRLYTNLIFFFSKTNSQENKTVNRYLFFFSKPSLTKKYSLSCCEVREIGFHEHSTSPFDKDGFVCSIASSKSSYVSGFTLLSSTSLEIYCVLLFTLSGTSILCNLVMKFNCCFKEVK